MLAALAFVLLPVASLSVLALAGLGAAELLGRRFPADARAALAAPTAAAALICASPLLKLGVPLGLLGLAALAVLAGIGIAQRDRVAEVIRAAGAPALVAVVALVLVATPSAIRGGWEAAAAYGNADIYLWVSQARSFDEGPPPEPASEFPDRRAYEMVDNLNWPVGLPFGTGLVAAAARADPADVYGAFSAVAFVLIGLATYFCGRAGFEMGPRRAVAAGVLVAANAYLLFSSFYGWQGQLLLTCFGVLSLVCYRLALERGALLGERVAAGGFAATAIATYGPKFGPYLALMAVSAVGFVLTTEPSRRQARHVLAATAAAAGFGLILGLEPILQGLLFVPTLTEFDLSYLEGNSRSLLADATGLVARIDMQFPAVGWAAIATVTAVPLLFAGVVAGWRHARRRDLVVLPTLALVAGLLVLQLPNFSPYFSMKLASYGTPLLVLTAVYGIRREFVRWPHLAYYGAALTSALVLVPLSTAVSMVEGVQLMKSSDKLSELEDVSTRLPAGAVLIEVADSWKETWSVYYLRDRRAVVPKPSGFLTDFETRWYGRESSTPYRYVLSGRRAPNPIWKGDGLTLVEATGVAPPTPTRADHTFG